MKLLFVLLNRMEYDLYDTTGRDIIIGFVGSIFLIAFIVFQVDKYKRSLNQSTYFSYKRNKGVYSILFLLLISIFFVNLALFPPRLSNPEEKIEYGNKHGFYQYSEEGYRELTKIYNNIQFSQMFLGGDYLNSLQDVSPNIKYHIEYIDVFFKNHIYDREINFLKNDYSNIEYLKEKKDIGNFGKGYIAFKNSDYLEAKKYWYQIENDTLYKLNYFKGKLFNIYKREDSARFYFNKELKLKKNNAAVYKEIISNYYWKKDFRNLHILYELKKYKTHFPNYVKAELLYRENRFLELNAYYFSQFINYLNPIGFIASLLITLVWFFYLYKIDFFQKNNLQSLIITFLISILFTSVIWYIYDFYSITLGLNFNGHFINDLIYSIFGIGIIEEVIKALPFLILLFFQKNNFKEPYDYILYASISALGFAFMENQMYYKETAAIDIIHSRALISVFFHVFASSIFAYGIILGKYKYKKNVVLLGIGSLFMAAIAHGFYDFWLISDSVKELYFITFFFYLICIHIWTDIRTIALNQSPNFEYEKVKKSKNLQYFIGFWLIAILMFEYLANGVRFGAEVANNQLIESTISGSYLIVFLSVSLGTFDLIKGYWNPISVPNKIIHYFLPKVTHAKNFVGYSVIIKPSKYNKIFPIQTELSGIITERKVIGKESDWFEVQLENSFSISTRSIETIYVKFYNENADINENKNLRVLTLFLYNEIEKNKIKIEKKNFKSLEWAFLDKKI